ncbi:hypothetical protein ALQ16_202369 [Pseudomonas syringae pv. actinidiae]|nr:hypothetical protein ALQ16_202369 [Pseudomonas syringae pv. actinidiae]
MGGYLIELAQRVVGDGRQQVTLGNAFNSAERVIPVDGLHARVVPLFEISALDRPTQQGGLVKGLPGLPLPVCPGLFLQLIMYIVSVSALALRVLCPGQTGTDVVVIEVGLFIGGCAGDDLISERQCVGKVDVVPTSGLA